MNIKLAALVALLLASPGQVMAEDVRVDCVPDQRIVCRDDETACRPPVKDEESVTYHFKFDLTKKTGSLVLCAIGRCIKPRPLTVVQDYCAFLGDHGAGCLGGSIYVWEPIGQATYTISNSRYVLTEALTYHATDGISDHSTSATEFGHCAVQ
jgi:hypothetical protein